ncbi:GPO family capsid scaffolding protein [Acinetobacter pollinis]|uniref:GPO family capsid scaffolding protein n=1 Tax=Acinetobacter pollinis TaxID=2605270 RepID=A0ABU6DUR5_9GAMM|nr:GPO family capsid scaffolding protein [Acinetobacter pollinis]MEB5477575.1 GPO family capsid scaffolding protein [Acinetobacter pollinis]
MSDKAKTNWFCIGVAGATTDGRAIDASWIKQMAANYDPKVYTAVVNVEHIKGAHPESSFGSYGTVLALKVENVTINGEEKPALYAQIKPNANLVKLTKAGQKLFTSMEVSPKFSDTDQAYLVGLAVTDNPASLGTEMLQFAAGAQVNPFAHKKTDPNNLFTATTEAIIEVEEEKTSVIDTIKSMFSKQNKKQAHEFSQHEEAIIEVAQQTQKFGNDLEELSTKFNRLETEYNSLKDQLSKEPANPSRPQTTSGFNATDKDDVVDC